MFLRRRKQRLKSSARPFLFLPLFHQYFFSALALTPPTPYGGITATRYGGSSGCGSNPSELTPAPFVCLGTRRYQVAQPRVPTKLHLTWYSGSNCYNAKSFAVLGTNDGGNTWTELFAETVRLANLNRVDLNCSANY